MTKSSKTSNRNDVVELTADVGPHEADACPFCGTEDGHSMTSTPGESWRITCTACGANGPIAASAAAAVVAWNVRRFDNNTLRFTADAGDESAPDDQIHTLAGLTCALWDAIGDLDTSEPLPRRTINKLSGLASASHGIAEGLSNRI